MVEFIGQRITPGFARWTAWILVGFYIILSGIGLFFQIPANTTPGNTPVPLLLFVVAVIIVGIWPVIGALIISHHPRHPVGWLLFVSFPVVAIDTLMLGYISYAESLASGSLMVPGAVFVWLNWSGEPFAVVAITLMNLLFPTGKLLSPGWRKVAWIGIATLPLYLAFQTVEPGPLSLYPSLDNPYAAGESAWAIMAPFYFIILAILILCSLASFVSLVLRLKQAKGDMRQQVKWLIIPAALFQIGVPLTFLTDYDPTGIALSIGVGLHLVSVPIIVIAVAFSIFKYRLYDVDFIINRTLVYGTLTACVAGLYILVVGGAGLVVQTNANMMGLLITAVLSVVFIRPVLSSLQRGVDRLMYGKSGKSPTPPSNTQTIQTATAESAASEAGQTTQTWLKFARLAWYPVATLAFAILIAAVPGFFIIGTEGNVDPRFSASPSALITMILRITIIAAVVASLVSLLLAVLLFRRRSTDRMAIVTSYVLLGYGVIMAGPFEALEPFIPGIAAFTTSVLIPLYQPFILLLFAIFPDGRFVPRWTRTGIAIIFLLAPLSLFWTTQLAQSSLDFTRPVILVLFGANIIVFIAILFMILYAQVYRYRHVSTQLQKQQTKWVLYGVGLWFIIQFLSAIPWIYTYSLPANIPYPPWLAVVTPFWIISIITIPLTLTIAVLRYRLFDIDFLINRSLLYGTLTIVVIGIYVLIVGALGTFFQAQGNLIIALLATGIVAVLFQPLRERFQRAVNRLVFGERDDPVEALSRLGRQLERAVPPNDVLPRLVKTIAQTLKLPYVAIQLPVEHGNIIAAKYGNPEPDMTYFPLVYHGDNIGRLVVARRNGGSAFSSAEMRLLRNIARQAGAAVHAVQLTIDLQHSRQRLVTTREEERRRLRRDLHDGLGATLAALNLEVGALKRSIRSNPDKAESLADELRQDIRDSIENIRLLVYELRPPTLDQLGLVEAVRAQARQCSQMYANGDSLLQVNVEAPETLPPLPAAVEVAAYRIAQEGLTNVVHHAQAQHCVVRLELADELIVEIVDDGIGLANGRHPNTGLGLLSMRERAEELGGTCLIEPAVGSGTRVVASLPLLEK